MVVFKYASKVPDGHEFHIVLDASLIGPLRDRILQWAGAAGFAAVAFATSKRRGAAAQEEELRRTGPVLVMRGDVLPVSYADMQALIAHSVPDVLTTGTQSVTDTISCCAAEKIIWHQNYAWTVAFTRQLAALTGHELLLQTRTQCGVAQVKALPATARSLARDWDFRVLGRPLMDALVGYAQAKVRHGAALARIERVVRHAPTKAAALAALARLARA